MKGLAEGVLKAFSIEPNRYSFVKNEEKEFHPGKSAQIKLQGKTLAVLGELHPSVLAKYGLKTSPIVMEMDLSVLFATQSGLKKMSPISKFPTVSRDIAIIVNEKLTSEEIIKEINDMNEKISMLERYGQDLTKNE